MDESIAFVVREKVVDNEDVAVKIEAVTSVCVAFNWFDADKLDEVEGDTSKITADNFEFSDKDTVKPKSLEDLPKT